MSIAAYGKYARQLETLVTDVAAGHWRRVGDDVTHALNGQASTELRRMVPRADRRATGSFFTTGRVRESYEGLLTRSTPSGQTPVIWDPTCGGGDLLIAATTQFPVGVSPAETLTVWNRRVRGHDLHDPYVAVARMRLLLAMLERHRAVGSDVPLTEDRWRAAFPRVQVGDGLLALREASQGRGFGGRLLLNPPTAWMRHSPAVPGRPVGHPWLRRSPLRRQSRWLRAGHSSPSCPMYFAAEAATGPGEASLPSDWSWRRFARTASSTITQT